MREWVKKYRYVNLIGATADDARDIMVHGESGIMSICHRNERPRHVDRELRWPNGAKSLIFTADEPDRLRGKQHEKLWADELASWRYSESWDQANYGLRLGDLPQAIITTTPRPTALVRMIIADPATIVTNGATFENHANLAPSFFKSIIKRYEGTRLGRQEIQGEVLDDNPHALFKASDIEAGRVKEAPALTRIVVAIDPAVTSGEESAETGIVVAGADVNGHGYLLADQSLRASPEGWARRAVLAYAEHKADRIVAESNNGGEMVASVLRMVDGSIPIKLVTASRGKAIRAEPIAALYEQHRIHHVGGFAALEDQMVNWDPLDPSAKSPDRMDAMVWAFSELLVTNNFGGALDYIRDNKVIAPAPAIIGVEVMSENLGG